MAKTKKTKKTKKVKKTKKATTNTTWIQASQAREILGVSSKNLAATAKRHKIRMKRNDGRSYLYNVDDVKKNA